MKKKLSKTYNEVLATASSSNHCSLSQIIIEFRTKIKLALIFIFLYILCIFLANPIISTLEYGHCHGIYSLGVNSIIGYNSLSMVGKTSCDRLIPLVPTCMIDRRHRDVNMLYIKDSASKVHEKL